MEKKCVIAPNGPPAVGLYSHAVAVGNLLFVSGFGPMAQDGSGVKRGTFESEARLTFSNLKAVLEDAGSSLSRVIKTTCYLADMNNFQEFNSIYKEYFTSDFPARTTLQAGRLPMDIQVEIEAVALIGG
ncbi:MAG: reactive intermediate/imine deaminase [Candidatus Hydrogenedentes bacterium]|nr:reactive intermediate/imine deaminase [Candidatus Hydrogenedentota bacterium]